MSSKALRWLELTAVLLEHLHPATRDEIFVRVAAYGVARQMAASDQVQGSGNAPESARRKFERDKDELRALGLTIETIRIAGGNAASQVGYVLRAGADGPISLSVSPARGSGGRSGPAEWQVSEDDLGVIDECLTRLAALRGHPLHAAAASAQRAISAGTVDSELGGQGPIRLMPQEQLALQVALALNTRGVAIGQRLARAWNPDSG